MEPVAAFRRQARSCADLGSPMYAGLLDRLVSDLEEGGPTARVVAGHEDDPGDSALPLRLLGSVHRLVLERRAGELTLYYPSVGGTWAPDAGSSAFLRLLAEQPEDAREWLDRPPQTNEVGRAAALVGGLLHLPADEHRDVRLFEIGASGGLNLLADRFGYVDTAGERYGRRSSPVVLDDAWTSTVMPRRRVQFAERHGCDLRPVDVGTTEGRLTLTAYVWPDQVHRLERLRSALDLAAEHPLDVRRLAAGDFVETITLRPSTTTVLWHSVMWQYLPGEEQERVAARIEQLGRLAEDDGSFVHLRLEPVRLRGEESPQFRVLMRTWPGGEERVLGTAHPHGVPVRWEPGVGIPG